MGSSGKMSFKIKFLILTILTIILFVALGLLGNLGDTRMILGGVIVSIVMSLLFYFLQIKMLTGPLAEIEEVRKVVLRPVLMLILVVGLVI